MQKADVARAPEPLGQHILQHQPEELRPWNRPALELPRLAIAITGLGMAYVDSFFETVLRSLLDDAILEHTEIATGWIKEIGRAHV